MGRRATTVLVLAVALALAPPPAWAETTPPADPAAPDPGGRDPRIVGGSVAPEGAWPAQVALLRTTTQGLRFTCGGTVIDRSWILTAAHCVSRPSSDPDAHFVARPSDIRVLAGTQDLRTGGTIIPTVEIRIVPGWDFSRLRNDVALLRLDRPVPPSITPVALAGTDPAPGTDVTAVGWGDLDSGAGTGTPLLRQVEMDAVSDATCTQRYGSLLDARSMTCANRPPAGTCQGDSGGPLFDRRGGTWTQVGVTSWALGCGEGNPTVFAQVATYSTWIRWQVRYGPHPDASAFVNRQHLDLLGRPPTDTELFSGVAALQDGQTPAAYVAGLLDGAPYSGRAGGVIRLYRAILRRAPDTGGLTFWMGEINRGVSLRRIADLMVRAPEFVERYGELDDPAFVELVYQSVLGRSPGPGEGGYWVEELASGRRTRGGVMVGFSESPENKAAQAASVRVIGAFHALLRRVPTPGESATWTGRSTSAIATFLLRTHTYAARF